MPRGNKTQPFLFLNLCRFKLFLPTIVQDYYLRARRHLDTISHAESPNIGIEATVNH